MTVAESIQSPRNFLGFRIKTKAPTPKQFYIQPEIQANYTRLPPDIPRQPHNPAVHPLLAKPVAREENFVLFPVRNASSKRKRDPNSPVRPTIRPKARDNERSEWTRYLSSYTEVDSPLKKWLIIVKGRFNMSNPPEPPINRPPGHLKAPIPLNDEQRVNVHNSLQQN